MPKVKRYKEETRRMPRAMEPAMPRVPNADEANSRISPLILNSIVRYKSLPGTNGIIETIRKVVAGTFTILANVSEYIEANTLARKHCIAVLFIPEEKL